MDSGGISFSEGRISSARGYKKRMMEITQGNLWAGVLVLSSQVFCESEDYLGGRVLWRKTLGRLRSRNGLEDRGQKVPFPPWTPLNLVWAASLE